MLCALLMAALAAAPAALARTDPAKPVRLIVPDPAGGTTDSVARAVAPVLAASLGPPVIVENTAGAGGTIGTAEAARAAPDGYTLRVAFDTHSVNHNLFKNLPYDPLPAFAPVSLMVQSPLRLVGAPNFAPANVREPVDDGKANPDKRNDGSTGTGNASHLASLALAQPEGFPAVHVPYKGGGPLVNDLLGGQINVALASMPRFVPHVKEGQLEALGRAGRERAPQRPQVPTVAETLPGLEAQSWVAMFAPAGTPQPVLARRARDVRTAVQRPDLKARLLGPRFIVVGSTPEALDAYFRAESEKWGKVIGELNVTLE